jgi:DinB superfamily
MAIDEVLVKSAVNSWRQIIGRIDKGLLPLSEEELQKQVAPDKNRLLYLLGHLTAVHDRMLPLLGLGERLHTELDETYISNPDRTRPDLIPPAEIKKAWSEVNDRLIVAFEKLSPAEWLQKHTAVSDEDFAKDPSRNRFAILLSRTNHASFHSGQMVLTK